MWCSVAAQLILLILLQIQLSQLGLRQNGPASSILIEHRNRCTVFVVVFVQGFCVLSKWRVGAWLGGVQQWSPPPPSLLLWCQASSAVPGHWPLHSPGTVYVHSTVLILKLNHSVNWHYNSCSISFSHSRTYILICHFNAVLLSHHATLKWFDYTNMKVHNGAAFSLFRIQQSHNAYKRFIRRQGLYKSYVQS